MSGQLLWAMQSLFMQEMEVAYAFTKGHKINHCTESCCANLVGVEILSSGCRVNEKSLGKFDAGLS
jgi:hypothetical protein